MPTGREAHETGEVRQLQDARRVHQSPSLHERPYLPLSSSPMATIACWPCFSELRRIASTIRRPSVSGDPVISEPSTGSDSPLQFSAVDSQAIEMTVERAEVDRIFRAEGCGVDGGSHPLGFGCLITPDLLARLRHSAGRSDRRTSRRRPSHLDKRLRPRSGTWWGNSRGASFFSCRGNRGDRPGCRRTPCHRSRSVRPRSSPSPGTTTGVGPP